MLLTFKQLASWVKKNCKFRINILTQTLFFKFKKEEWKPYDYLDLLNEIQKKGGNFKTSLVKIVVGANIPKERYNPIKEYFESLPSEDEKYIDYAASFVTMATEKENIIWHRQFRLWLIRAVECAIDDYKVNKHAIIFYSPNQNIGKTAFLNYLTPQQLSDYTISSLHYRVEKWDIQVSKNFIINLDEVGFYGRRLDRVKSLISAPYTMSFVPFKHQTEKLSRTASFVGTTNDKFIRDKTGSCRWITFTVKNINYDYNNHLNKTKKLDINKLWSAAYGLVLAGKNGVINQKEMIEIEENNEQYYHESLLPKPEKGPVPKQFVRWKEKQAEAEFQQIDEDALSEKIKEEIDNWAERTTAEMDDEDNKPIAGEDKYARRRRILKNTLITAGTAASAYYGRHYIGLGLVKVSLAVAKIAALIASGGNYLV